MQEYIVQASSISGIGTTMEFIVKSNKSPDEVAYAMNALSVRLGRDFQRMFCFYYEDDEVDIFDMDSFLSLGVNDNLKTKILECLAYDNFEREVPEWKEGLLTIEIYNSLPRDESEPFKFNFVQVSDFVEMILHCIKVELPDFEFEFVEKQTLLYGIGYGLLS